MKKIHVQDYAPAVDYETAMKPEVKDCIHATSRHFPLIGVTSHLNNSFNCLWWVWSLIILYHTERKKGAKKRISKECGNHKVILCSHKKSILFKIVITDRCRTINWTSSWKGGTLLNKHSTAFSFDRKTVYEVKSWKELFKVYHRYSLSLLISNLVHSLNRSAFHLFCLNNIWIKL